MIFKFRDFLLRGKGNKVRGLTLGVEGSMTISVSGDLIVKSLSFSPRAFYSLGAARALLRHFEKQCDSRVFFSHPQVRFMAAGTTGGLCRTRHLNTVRSV